MDYLLPTLFPKKISAFSTGSLSVLFCGDQLCKTALSEDFFSYSTLPSKWVEDMQGI